MHEVFVRRRIKIDCSEEFCARCRFVAWINRSDMGPGLVVPGGLKYQPFCNEFDQVLIVQGEAQTALTRPGDPFNRTVIVKRCDDCKAAEIEIENPSDDLLAKIKGLVEKIEHQRWQSSPSDLTPEQVEYNRVFAAQVAQGVLELIDPKLLHGEEQDADDTGAAGTELHGPERT